MFQFTPEELGRCGQAEREDSGQTFDAETQRRRGRPKTGFLRVSASLRQKVFRYFEEALKNMKKIWISAGLACALTLAGCGGGEEKKEAAKAPETAPAAAPAAAADDANAATVTGKVKLDGAAPAAKNLDMSATPFLHQGAHRSGQE
jgi:hypothetical protein